MGIADQFKDKAQELADQAKQKKMAGKGKRDDARERPAGVSDEASERVSERGPGGGRSRQPGQSGRSGQSGQSGQSGMKERAKDAGEQARERFDR
jgi:hypothetical protein